MRTKRAFHRGSLIAMVVVVAITVLAPGGSPSAVWAMKIAIPVNGLPEGQVIIGTGKLGSGTLNCNAVALGHARFGVAIAQGDETRTLMFFQDAVNPGDGFSIVNQVSPIPCPDATGTNYWLYNTNP